jgi:3-methyl-2-oxobutanoate hydroxymethyltransferase
MKRKTINEILKISGDRKIKMLTTYTANVARLTEKIADILLVGDSLGMVLYGMPSTHGVTLDMIINHTRAVVLAAKLPLIIADMPFGTVEKNKEEAFESCAKVIAQTSCDAVKIEGGAEMAETIKFLVERGIPVCGHVGLMPQKVKTIGSYKKITDEEKILADFESIINAGVFAVVLENTDESIGKKIAEKFPSVLTIGIGAGNYCKGRVAVFEDLINLSTESIPPFSKPVIDIKPIILTELEKFFEN